jgi:hypothetical protein
VNGKRHADSVHSWNVTADVIPNRSEAEWRDLLFGGPLVEMFFDRSEAKWRDLRF